MMSLSIVVVDGCCRAGTASYPNDLAFLRELFSSPGSPGEVSARRRVSQRDGWGLCPVRKEVSA